LGKEPEAARYLEQLAQGSILRSALYFEDMGGIERKSSGTEVDFDSPFRRRRTPLVRHRAAHPSRTKQATLDGACRSARRWSWPTVMFPEVALARPFAAHVNASPFVAKARPGGFATTLILEGQECWSCGSGVVAGRVQVSAWTAKRMRCDRVAEVCWGWKATQLPQRTSSVLTTLPRQAQTCFLQEIFAHWRADADRQGQYRWTVVVDGGGETTESTADHLQGEWKATAPSYRSTGATANDACTGGNVQIHLGRNESADLHTLKLRENQGGEGRLVLPSVICTSKLSETGKT